MAIDMATLQEEKVLLQKDFEEMKKNIQKVEVDLIQMKANMNAINGAIQQTDRLLNRLRNEGEEKSKKMKEVLAK
jgi:septal ring factor EnvC (AmiA/AmiB activator)